LLTSFAGGTGSDFLLPVLTCTEVPIVYFPVDAL
jgi:hypothetical protein